MILDAWAIGLLVLVLALIGVGVWLYLKAKRALPHAQAIETVDVLIPDSRFVEFDGTRIHYVQAGDGPDIVLLHGIGASVFVWRFLFPLLQTRFRVTAFDIPGFGQSSKDARRDYGLDAQSQVLARAMTEIGIDKPILVGSSMGGAISLWMSKLFPERFPRVIALAPATESSMIPAHVRHFALATPLLRRALNRRTMKQLVSRVVARQSLVTDDVVEAYLKPFMNDQGLGVRAFWSATSLLADRRLPSALAGIGTRVLIIHGTRDLMVSRRSIHRLVGLLPNATLLIHADGGHHIMEDEPAWTARTLLEFIKSTQ